MIGSGTEESPYKIKTVDDFLDIKDNPDGSETFYILESDIDFNDSEYKTGIYNSNIVMARKSIIDAQNKRIRNIILKSTDEYLAAFTFKKIKNAFIENVVLEEAGKFDAKSGLFNCKFESCAFSIDIANSNFVMLYSRHDGSRNSSSSLNIVPPTFENCSFTLYGSAQGDNTYSIVMLRANFLRCHFIFENLICNGSGYNNNYIDLQLCADNSTFDTVYFTGKIKQTYTRKADHSDCTWGLSHWGTFSSCYWAVQITTPEDIIFKNITHNTQWSPTISSTCFVDKDLIISEEGGTISDFGSLKNISTEQAKSLEYLQSIGFPTFAG